MKKTYTIATGNFESTNAAAEILDDGGNAYDAILAALFMSFVCEPLLSSPGGGGYLLAHPNKGNAHIFDFFAQTPHAKDIDVKDFYPIHGDFGATQQEFHIGMASSAIPGVPAGIFAIHDHYGTMPLTEIASAAINKARSGVVVDNHYAEVVKILTPILQSSNTAIEMFSNDNSDFLTPRDIKANLALADFLEAFSSHKKDWFYRETPAKNIVADMTQLHGLLRQNDFESYKVILREPLLAEINNWQVLTNAQPTTGGFLITEQLKHAFKNDSKDLNHKLIEAMIHADNLKKQQDFHSSKGTTHMSVIDTKGNVASMTVSNGEGSGYVVPDCGFMLNNFLGEEDININGFFNFQENTRMISMMSPTILENNGNRIALGTGGSNRIKTALFQVIWQIIAENKTMDQAINHPRLHFENGVLDIEKGFDKQSINVLKKQYEKINHWQHRSLYFGGINAVQHGTTNLAIGDSRRNGVGLVKNIG